MIREIKFRGKDIETGEWIYGSLVQPIGQNPRVYVQDVKTEGVVSFFVYDVEESTVGQFTGLLDKNGKEVYEGDIIRSYDSENNPIIHSISWDNKKAYYVATMLQYPLLGGSIDKDWIDEFEKEVIGNIHDNPEILKNK